MQIIPEVQFIPLRVTDWFTFAHIVIPLHDRLDRMRGSHGKTS